MMFLSFVLYLPDSDTTISLHRRAASKEDKPKKGGKKRWIPNTKKGEKQKKAIAKKAGKGKKGGKAR